MKTIREAFKLDETSCDAIAELIMAFCQEVGADRKDALRYRLSAEECLLYWMEHGFAGNDVVFQTGRFLLSPYFTLDVRGMSLNPYADENEQLGAYTDGVLVSLGLSPEYSYNRDFNRIRFSVKKKERGQITTLRLVLGAAAAIGVLGLLLIPEGIRNLLLDILINPLYDAFFKILGCIAGPMIFLSVAWGVYGIGDASTFSRIGRGLMLRYTLITLAVAAGGVLCFPILGPKLSTGTGSLGQLQAIAEMLFGIIPSNIVEPFATGNTLQIIFLAVSIGIGLLYMGRKTSSVANAIDQINLLVQFLMQFISGMVPYVIFLVVISMIWSGSLSVFSSTWKLFACLIVTMFLASTAFLAATSIKMKVSPLLLIRKSIPTFLIAFTTASSAASFGSNVETCEKEFGINPSLIRFGIPLGMVMHKPMCAVYDLLAVFYFANQYGVSSSIGWICIAAFISGIIAIATPPIPGGGAIAYSVLFLQMGIPSEALAIALAIDMIADFLITSFEMFNLPLSLINIASNFGMIDTEVLRQD